YGPYLTSGIGGMMLATFLIGLIVTLVYQRAIHESRVAQILYASLAAGLLLSPIGEFFFTTLNFLGKLWLVTWLVYRFPLAWKGFRNLIGRGVQAGLAHHQALSD